MYRMNLFLCLLLFVSCSRKPAPAHDTDLTCVNSFIRSIYDGNFDDAEKIMTNDEASRKCLQQSRFNYNQTMTRELKLQYKHGAVTLKKEPVSDSVVVFICTDPVFGSTKPYKTVRRNNEWLVDFSYSCSGNL